MSARRKVYVSLPGHILDRIERERAAAEVREDTPVTTSDVIEVLLTLGLEFGGEDA
ncbi:hypothetical protein [Bradyrhizobium sp. NAS80.1]|uniref:hypothetical protein n=1 Tax=Bradyrhizobium sp. NAS80.1 TaxID=1680159 RepID=UPI00143D734D|nr:hypothetical protein [Bradyrhizobium sp. NAS80.1]